jgi:alpha-beta hydrolase superfamily lysophospholipase
MSLVYAGHVGGSVSPLQVAAAAYFAAGMLYLLKWFDVGVTWLVRWTCRCQSPRSPRWRVEAAALFRLVLVISIALPYVMASAMTYRIKVQPTGNPTTVEHWTYTGDIHFPSIDGVDLSAWWIPAQGSRGPRSALWGKRTVLLCHGLSANKANQLDLVRELVPAGFNVLAFDFRAHGESGGQLSSFGDLERYDVLGAVRWLRQNHPDESTAIDGLGISMGAAALIAAAADDSPEGRAITAIAAYSTYNDLPSLAESLGEQLFFPGAGWIADHLMLPMAAAQTGADLRQFSPANLLAERVARPVLIIQGEQDRLIDFSLGQALYQAAEQPKERLWIERAGHDDIVASDRAAYGVMSFFLHARTVI